MDISAASARLAGVLLRTQDDPTPRMLSRLVNQLLAETVVRPRTWPSRSWSGPRLVIIPGFGFAWRVYVDGLVPKKRILLRLCDCGELGSSERSNNVCAMGPHSFIALLLRHYGYCVITT